MPYVMGQDIDLRFTFTFGSWLAVLIALWRIGTGLYELIRVMVVIYDQHCTLWEERCMTLGIRMPDGQRVMFGSKGALDAFLRGRRERIKKERERKEEDARRARYHEMD